MIGLLNAYHFDLTPGSYQETYEPMTIAYLNKIMPNKEIRAFQVAQGEFPETVEACEGWILTGSPASAYDSAKWIEDLIAFTQGCHQQKKKMVGLCFGHQLIAKALGGEVEKSNKGWGIGARSFKLLERTEWMQPALDRPCGLLFSHQDQVTRLPPGAKHLARDPFCEFQMFSLEGHVLSMQGHPEFTREYAQKRYEARRSNFGPDVYATGIASLKNETDEWVVGSWIKNFFG